MVAMNVHPSQDHKWDHMAHVKGRSGWIYSTVHADSFLGEELVKLVSTTVIVSLVVGTGEVEVRYPMI